MKKLAIILHNNVEEIEAITVIDLLRRAQFIVDLFATNELEIIGSHKIHFQAEKKLSTLKVEDYEGIIFPGGPAVDELLKDKRMVDLALTFNQQKKLVAAICAAPQILGQAGLLKGKTVTHFPGADQFMEAAIEKIDEEVIVQDNIITSAAAGTAIAFSLAIIEYLGGSELKNDIKKRIVYHY